MWVDGQYFEDAEPVGTVTVQERLPSHWRAEYRGKALGTFRAEAAARRAIEMASFADRARREREAAALDMRPEETR